MRDPAPTPLFQARLPKRAPGRGKDHQELRHLVAWYLMLLCDVEDAPEDQPTGQMQACHELYKALLAFQLPF